MAGTPQPPEQLLLSPRGRTADAEAHFQDGRQQPAEQDDDADRDHLELEVVA